VSSCPRIIISLPHLKPNLRFHYLQQAIRKGNKRMA
jgi:hypothetical protein